MIVRGLFELVYTLLNVVLTPFQIIPDLPASFQSYINVFKNFISDGVGIVLYFLPIGFVKICIPIVIIIMNMEHIWDGILWILKKLPFVGIE